MNNSCQSQIGYIENNLYKRSGNRPFNNTNNTSKHRNQYNTDVVNSYKPDEVSNL